MKPSYSTKAPNGSAPPPQREIQAFALYRVLVALLLLLLLATPLNTLSEHSHAIWLATIAAVVYLGAACLLAFQARHETLSATQIFWNACLDIAITGILLHALSGISIALAVSLVVNLTAAATLLPRGRSAILATLACLMIIIEQLLRLHEGFASSTPVEIGLLMACYLALTWIGYQQGQRNRSSQALAERRGAEVANLYEVNALILRRMRTGVLVVDDRNRIILANEAAIALLGHAPQQGNEESTRLPRNLAERLYRWRAGWHHDQAPVQLPGSATDVQPRFASLMADSDQALIFLDDTAVASRRAESLTLAALGRFSASLAHEIRNPLAAISYANQLLAESPRLDADDQRLITIITHQCQRTNSIIESVLGMARRERANPENIELGLFLPRFIEDYRPILPGDRDELQFVQTAASVTAVVDPGHLQQILTILIHNALRHGRPQGQPAQIRLRLSRDRQRAHIDCIDNGPGLPADKVDEVFKPFYTTDENGTGLGLYLARELAVANHGQLTHQPPLPGQHGACFRITLPSPDRQT